jgi:hypothetical protein
MAYQAIGRGTSANDGTGDDLRSGAGKLNANFVELYTKFGNGTTLSSDSFVTLTGSETLTNKTITGSLTGNATTATALAAAVNIAGQSFDGSAAITIASTDLSDAASLVTAASTTTFTNKTLTAPIVGGDITTASGNLSVDTATQIIEVKGDGSAVEGQILLNCHANSHGQTIKPQPHSAAVTNVLTLPAGADQELVGTLDSQTLENKSLTAPTITGGGTATFATVDAQFIASESTFTGDGSATIVLSASSGFNLVESSASAEAATLAEGSAIGQMTSIILVTDGGGDVTITPAQFLNGSTITLADVGDMVQLIWTGSNGWAMAGNGYGSPVIA